MTKLSSNVQGILSLLLAMLILSLQDVAVKGMGGRYPVLEIVIFRGMVALPCTFIFLRGEGVRGLPATRQPMLEYIRGLFLFLAFTTYMMGLAALPLADIAAIRNSAPLMITFLSVVWLGEKVDWQHWLALVVGFGGVLMIVQPGSSAFNLGSIFALASTLFYALNVMLTRRLRTTDSSATMAYYSSWVYLAVSMLLAPLVLAIGENQGMHPSLAFLFHPWQIPSLFDWAVMSGLGLVWAAGMYLVARAYSLALASVAALFEYSPLLINIFWGWLLWQEFPTWQTLAGAFLTLASGLYVFYKERRPTA